MANQEHLDILKQGVIAWNQWREERAEEFLHEPLSIEDLVSKKGYLRARKFIDVDLSGIDLSRTNLLHINFSNTNLRNVVLEKAILTEAHLDHADLRKANLDKAILVRAQFFLANLFKAKLRNARLWGAHFNFANLKGVDLSGASLRDADLSKADLRGAHLIEADLSGADLHYANLKGADLTGANLSRATLVETNFTEALLTNSRIYGIAAWNVELKGAKQDNLVITPKDEPSITVDNLKIAQFIYLLLNNDEIRNAIDTIAKKAVLILGRFIPERKAVLNALREALRTHGYLPILFDFDKPASRDITETVSTLAHLARFVIADITDAKSIPQELMLIVPNLPSIPVQPLILNSQHEYDMFEHFTRYPWVLPVYRYNDEPSLLQSLQEKVIMPAEQKAKELAKR